MLLSLKCYSAEWIAVGQQPELPNIGQLEIQLWKYLEKKNNAEFKSKDVYRFIDESLILINALCLQSSEGEAVSSLGAYPIPTTEELKRQLYQVYDGGGCFFNIKYNIKNARFHSLYVSGR